MNGQQMITFFNSLIDDSVDDDEALALFNLVKDIVEAD